MSKNQRLNASITVGAVLEQSVRRNIGFLKSGLSKVGDAIKGVEKRQRELAKQRRVLIKEGKSVEALDREYQQLEDQLVRLRRAQERWNRAATASRKVGSSFTAMASDIGRTARTLAVGAAAAGGAVFGLASSTAALGDDVAKTADKIGMSIEGLQELRYAAERSGVATSSFDSAMEKMGKNLGEALSGTGTAKDALEELGLSAKDLVALSPEEALAVIADRMSTVESQAEKAAIANDIFGRSGIAMINMLRDGSQGLADLREDARRTGYVLSEEAARDAEVFQDTLLDLQLVGKGFRNTIGAALMPAVTKAMSRISEALIGNREQVEEWAEKFADSVEAGLPILGEVVTGLGKVGSAVRSVATKTAEMVGGWENFGVIIGAVLASKTIMSVVKFAGAVFSLGRALGVLALTTPLVAGGIKALGVALVANPIGLIVAGIAAGGYLVWKNWEGIGEFFTGLWADVKSVFVGFGDFVAGVFTLDMDRAAAGIGTAWEGMKGVVSKHFAVLGGLLSAPWNGVIKPIMDKFGLTDPISDAWDTAKAKVGAALAEAGAFFTSAWETISPVIDGLMSGELIAAAWESVQTKLGAVLDWIAAKFEWVGGIVTPIIDKLIWVKEKGASALAAIGLGGGDDEEEPITRRALGGHFLPGALLTGERGAELKYERRAGWVAHSRELQRMAANAGRSVRAAGQAAVAGGGDMQALLSRVSAPVMVPATAGGVTQHITNHIHAAGTSAEEIVAVLERKARLAKGSALYDDRRLGG